MFEIEMLEDWLHDDELSLCDKLLLCLAVNSNEQKDPVKIAIIASDAGWNCFNKFPHSLSPLSVNIDQALEHHGATYALRIRGYWKLNQKGLAHVRSLVASLKNAPEPAAASTLRDVLNGIKNQDVRLFVEEAINDIEHKAYRSAVVLSWCGAVALLRDHLLDDAGLLLAFNTEAKKRNAKWKEVRVQDDFGRMKEYDFLQVLHTVCIDVSKDLKQQLENALKLRNSCGHPNSLKIDLHMVQAHVSFLALNVFAKFG